MEDKVGDALPPIPGKRYYTISEAAALVGVAPSALRFWESEFKQLSPRRHGSRRRYEEKDILQAREIRSLLYDEGYTLAGAKQILRKKGVKKRKKALLTPDFPRDAVVRELEEIRDSIKDFLF